MAAFLLHSEQMMEEGVVAKNSLGMERHEGTLAAADVALIVSGLVETLSPSLAIGGNSLLLIPLSSPSELCYSLKGITL